MSLPIQKYVIGANVLFSAFISGKDVYALLFSQHAIHLPDFAFLEIEKYRQRILKKTTLREADFQEFVLCLMSHVTVIPSLLLSQASVARAWGLCRDIDEKDTPYVAAALELNMPLITNDRKLYTKLKSYEFLQVLLLGDVIGGLPEI